MDEIKELYNKKIFIIFNIEYQKHYNGENLGQDTYTSLMQLMEKGNNLKVQMMKKEAVLREEIAKLKLESENINYYLKKLNIYNFRIRFPDDSSTFLMFC